MRLKLHVQYDGQRFYGWQMQPEVPTVCGVLVKAFSKLKLGEVDPVAAGRTDAGVHAWGQVVHVDVAKRMELVKYMDGLNRFLPESVRVVRVAEVDETFHARFEANTRHYKYLLWEKRQLRPDLVGRVGHVREAVDVEKMAQAVELMGLGKQDFSSFRDAECQSKSPVCNIRYARIFRNDSGLVVFEVAADKFLHHMVRTMVGTLLKVGLGEQKPEWIQDVIAARDRKKAGITFDAAGLYLVGVDYNAHTELGHAGELTL